MLCPSVETPFTQITHKIHTIARREAMKRFSASCLAMLLAAFTLAQPFTAKAQDPVTSTGQERPAFPGRAEQAADPRPYDKVITKDAKSDKGVFTVHRVKDKFYYEIPKSELGKEFLWVSQIAKTTFGVGYGGQAMGNRVVKWDRHGNRVLLKSVNYEMVAEPRAPA